MACSQRHSRPASQPWQPAHKHGAEQLWGTHVNSDNWKANWSRCRY
jgi:hypothetical protein